jgi:hypothetical protein
MKSLPRLALLSACAPLAALAVYAPIPESDQGKALAYRLGASVYYDSNIFGAATNEVDSLVYNISPSVSFNSSVTDQTFVSAGYELSYDYIQDRPGKKSLTSHTLNGRVAHKFNEASSVDVSDAYIISKNPQSLLAGVPLNTDQSFKRNEFNARYTTEARQKLAAIRARLSGQTASVAAVPAFAAGAPGPAATAPVARSGSGDVTALNAQVRELAEALSRAQTANSKFADANQQLAVDKARAEQQAEVRDREAKALVEQLRAQNQRLAADVEKLSTERAATEQQLRAAEQGRADAEARLKSAAPAGSRDGAGRPRRRPRRTRTQPVRLHRPRVPPQGAGRRTRRASPAPRGERADRHRGHRRQRRTHQGARRTRRRQPCPARARDACGRTRQRSFPPAGPARRQQARRGHRRPPGARG